MKKTEDKELSDFSLEYQNKTKQEHRQKYGQYFTQKSLRDLALKCLPKTEQDISIVELSCGSGEFISSILEKYPNAQIDGYEIEFALAKHCQERFSDNHNVHIFNVNTLEYYLSKGFFSNGKEKRYKFCIGNPPYFELDAEKKSDSKSPTLGSKLREKYKDIINGRPNIYAIFIKLGIDLLEDNGYLSYVVPTSMLNGSYFSKLRDYIIKTCSIVDIILKDANHFDGALQNVMILILKKAPNDGRFIFSHNGITIFTPEWKSLQNTFSSAKTLSELGFVVKTGNVVWNQRKDYLSNDNNDTLLIWADNITKNGFSLNDHKTTTTSKKTNKKIKKYQYIKNIKKEELQNGPVIVVNRISGVGKSASLRACLYNNKKGFVCENHVNVISATKDACMTIQDLLPHIQKYQAMKVIRKITGNTQVSKTELEKLFPIWVSNNQDDKKRQT
jgi:adenine-specific DNA-methyltransferase